MKKIFGLIALSAVAALAGCNSADRTTASSSEVKVGCSGEAACAEGKTCSKGESCCNADKSAKVMSGEKSCSEAKSCSEGKAGCSESAAKKNQN